MEEELLFLIETNKALIYKTANKFYGVEKEDLYQAGVIGIINAYNSFMPSLNTKFSTYAYKYIFGEMYKLMLASKHIKINKDVLFSFKEIERARDYLRNVNNKEPSYGELANFIGIDETDIYLIIKSCEEVLSLDSPYDSECCLMDIVGMEENYDLKIIIDSMIESMPEPDRSIIIERYYIDETQSNVAKKLSLSQAKVSRIEKNCLRRMRKEIGN